MSEQNDEYAFQPYPVNGMPDLVKEVWDQYLDGVEVELAFPDAGKIEVRIRMSYEELDHMDDLRRSRVANYLKAQLRDLRNWRQGKAPGATSRELVRWAKEPGGWLAKKVAR